jgi:hypothetical protein
MFGQFISNGHMAGNFPSMTGLRHDRHNNSALQLLITLLVQSNGRCWEIITADIGHKPIKTFTTDTFSEPLPTLDTPSIQHSQMPTRKVDADEGLDHSFLTHCPAVISTDILPSHLIPPAHKLGFIRLLEPRHVGHTSSRSRRYVYLSSRKFQIRGWTYCTNTNLFVISKHTPLANVLHAHVGMVHMWTSYPKS